MMDASDAPLGTKLKGICDLCEDDPPRTLIVTDAGAVCRSCFLELKRDGAFDGLASFERKALGLPDARMEWGNDT